MIYKRIIPLFLLKGKRLVKGTNFRDFVDVGDPVSQGMVYDAQGADEIIVVDIEATRQGRVIDTDIIKEMVRKCRLPVTAGGGIRNIRDAKRCFGAGADKIALNTSAVYDTSLIKKLAKEFGSQSVVVSIDVKKGRGGNYEVYVLSGSKKADVDLKDHISRVIDSGAGEIMLTSIDKEGTLSGFDYGLYKSVRNIIPVPLIASGGVSYYDDIVKIFNEIDCDACGIGKMLFLRDYDIVRIKAYLKNAGVCARDS